MALDRLRAPRVAWVLFATACGPAFKPPDTPPPEPGGPVAKMTPAPVVTGGGRHVVVGEMCPDGAAGRPGVAPLLMRGVTWSDTAADVAAAVERGSVPRFIVFGTDGKMAGAFDTLGVADIAGGQTVATGTYAGASPCTYGLTAKPKAGEVATRGEDPKCGPATNHCGLAVGEMVHPDEPPATPAYTTGGACMSGDYLAVDIDGDGRVESFPIATVLDGIRGPAAEWSAAPGGQTSCTPTFQIFNLQLFPEPEKGKAVDQKAMVTFDLLGVVDLDGDGRRELVIALRFPTVRTIVVYSASGMAQRLELVGEAQSFQH